MSTFFYKTTLKTVRTIDYVIGPLNRNGMYQHLLDEWLLPMVEADDPEILGEALGQIGKQYLHIGGYNTALDYLKKSLAIQKEIGDASGLCATIFNIGHIHLQNGDHREAMDAWASVYGMAKRINLFQALEALETLADHLKLSGGMNAWETWLDKMKNSD